MSDRLTLDQLIALTTPAELTTARYVPYGTELAVAVTRGPGWAQAAVLAGHVPDMEGLDLMLRARILLNRVHLAEHEGTYCPTSWADCLDVVPAYWRWVGLLERECQLYLRAVRELQ